MEVALLRAELHLPGARSLKAKRRPLKSLLAHLRNKFHAAAAEVGHQELHQRAAIGVALVGADGAHAGEQLASVRAYIERNPEFVVLDIQTESVSGPEGGFA